MARSRKDIQHPKDFVLKRTIGEYEIELPKPPKMEEIDNYDLPVHEQKFYRPEDLDEFDYLEPEEQEAIQDREWDRRENGYWFYCNGNIEYITGCHYFYLAHWRLDVGYPNFVDADRDYFYWWRLVETNENAHGGIYISHRREGKTYKAMNIVYEGVSRKQFALGAIQSKTGGDGKKVFRKLVKSWQKMSEFFKPADSGETNPSSSIKFEEPSKRSSKGAKKKYKMVLNSEITWAPATEEAYDGDKVFRGFHDEIGKTVEANVYERWGIFKECMSQGSKIVGKAILTSTVEEMNKKGGANCKRLWDESDIDNLDDNGRTITGLLRYFKPADYGLEGFYDEYGYSDREAARDYVTKMYKGKKGGALLAVKRKYPLEVSHCWLIEGDNSPFDQIKLNEQLEYNTGLPQIQPDYMARGDFEWIGGKRDGKVEFRHSETGKWKVSWMPPKDLRNKYTVRGNKRMPGNVDLACAGLDPFDHSITTAGRQSNASCHVFRKYDPMNPRGSNAFVAQYLNRPPTAPEMYEDMIKMSVFYGIEILIEDNKPGCINHFEGRGYGGYLMERPAETHTAYSEMTHKQKKKKGISMTGEAPRTALIEVLQAYIFHNIGYIEPDNGEGYYGNCPFDELLKDWLDFNPVKWTDYDATVSSGLALLGSRKLKKRKAREVKPLELVKKYNVKGNRSYRLK
jgi:hypothetical protein